MVGQQIGKRARAISYILMLVYFASYCTRINFTVMLVKIGSDLGQSKTSLAVVVTALTVSYALGQIISGMLADKVKPAMLLTLGLIVSSACNAAIFFTSSIPLMAVIWCVNGTSQALLWPPIVRIMTMYLTDDEYGYAAVRVSWGSSIATIVLYTLAPLLLYVVSWRVVMLICAALGLSVMLLWCALYPRLLTEPIVQMQKKDSGEKSEGEKLPKFVYIPIALILLGIVLQGILRDGVANWMPSYLCETFNIPEEKAIIATVIQAVFSMLSFYVFDLVHRKLFRNEVFCSAVIFAFSAVCAVVLYLVNLFFSSAPLSLVLMAMIVGCMHGINLMLITVVPKRMLRSGKVSTWSGIFNSCTYVGSSASTYGIALIADSRGWGFTILTWAIVSLAGFSVCFLAARGWRRFVKDYAS